jgi:hypothetical protein
LRRKAVAPPDRSEKDAVLHTAIDIEIRALGVFLYD